MELTQIRLLVSDFPAVYRFYRDVLGFKPQFDAESGPYAKLGPDTGDAAIALHDREQMAGVLGQLAAEPAGHRALVVLRVDDLDAAHLADPAGNLIELQEWLAPRQQPGDTPT